MVVCVPRDSAGRRRRSEAHPHSRRHLAHEARRRAAGQSRWPLDRRVGRRTGLRRQRAAQRSVAHRHRRAPLQPPADLDAPARKRRHLESRQPPHRLQRAARQRRRGADLFARSRRRAAKRSALTNLSGGARSPVFSHDGRQLAFVSLMYPQARDDAANKKLIEAHRARKANVAHLRRLSRSAAGIAGSTNARRASSCRRSTRTGSPPAVRAICWPARRSRRAPGFAGRQTDTGEEIEVEFTPDNQSLVFAATTNRNAAAYAFTDSQLFVVSVAGGEPRQITTGPAHLVAAALHARRPHAARGARDPGRERLQPVAPRGVRPGPICGSTSSPAASIARWTASRCRRIRATCTSPPRTAATKSCIPRASRAARCRRCSASTEGSYTNLAIPARAGKLALVRELGKRQRTRRDRADHARSPARRWCSPSSTRRAPRSSTCRAIENFWFTSSRGKRIHSFVVRPPGFDASKKYPLFVVIHGGPHGMWRDQFFVRWNYHLLAAPGYVLLLTNYSGSTGFGEEFARSIQGDPLKGPADEINEAADAAIKQFAFIDGSRQCAGGASYGGHLSNWLQGTTTRYKCLVSHAGLVNLEAQWGTSDTIYSREVNLGGPPWEQGARVARAESDPLRREVPYAGAGHGRRKRLPRAAQQLARILERAAAHAGAEPAHRVSRREPLDPERRGQPAVLRGDRRVARPLARARELRKE